MDTGLREDSRNRVSHISIAAHRPRDPRDLSWALLDEQAHLSSGSGLARRIPPGPAPSLLPPTREGVTQLSARGTAAVTAAAKGGFGRGVGGRCVSERES